MSLPGTIDVCFLKAAIHTVNYKMIIECFYKINSIIYPVIFMDLPHAIPTYQS